MNVVEGRWNTTQQGGSLGRELRSKVLSRIYVKPGGEYFQFQCWQGGDRETLGAYKPASGACSVSPSFLWQALSQKQKADMHLKANT